MEQERKDKAEARQTPAELIAGLEDHADGAKQIDACKNIVVAGLKLSGKEQREFQDTMTPGLDALVTMAESEDNARRTAAFDALHRLLMYLLRGM